VDVTLSSDERVMLLVCERFARTDGVVEIERANVYTVRGEEIVEIWIFEGDQYAVDQLIAASWGPSACSHIPSG
jgi:hypothetical protein